MMKNSKTTRLINYKTISNHGEIKRLKRQYNTGLLHRCIRGKFHDAEQDRMFGQFCFHLLKIPSNYSRCTEQQPEQCQVYHIKQAKWTWLV